MVDSFDAIGTRAVGAVGHPAEERHDRDSPERTRRNASATGGYRQAGSDAASSSGVVR